jgi:uncharacterized repeat protein (TIGR03803 family)
MHGPPHDCKGKQKGVDCTDGSTPYASPVQASDGNLYGTTYDGGANYKSCSGGCGTIFTITTAGTLTTLYNFCSNRSALTGVRQKVDWCKTPAAASSRYDLLRRDCG